MCEWEREINILESQRDYNVIICYIKYYGVGENKKRCQLRVKKIFFVVVDIPLLQLKKFYFQNSKFSKVSKTHNFFISFSFIYLYVFFVERPSYVIAKDNRYQSTMRELLLFLFHQTYKPAWIGTRDLPLTIRVFFITTLPIWVVLLSWPFFDSSMWSTYKILRLRTTHLSLSLPLPSYIFFTSPSFHPDPYFGF